MGACSSTEEGRSRRSKKKGGGHAKDLNKSGSANSRRSGGGAAAKRKHAAADAAAVDAAPVVDFVAIWNQPPPPSILKNGSNSAASSYRDRENVNPPDLRPNPLSPLAASAAPSEPQHPPAPRPRKVTMTPDASERSRSDGPLNLQLQRSLDGRLNSSSINALDKQQSEASLDARRATVADGSSPPVLAIQQPSSESPQSSRGAIEGSVPRELTESEGGDATHGLGTLVSDDTAPTFSEQYGSTSESYSSQHTTVARIIAASEPPPPTVKLQQSTVSPNVAHRRPIREEPTPLPTSTPSRPLARAAAAQPSGPLVTIRGTVYNLEPLLNRHPGGAGVLKKYHGKDGTDEFLKSHSIPPFAALSKYAVPVEL